MYAVVLLHCRYADVHSTSQYNEKLTSFGYISIPKLPQDETLRLVSPAGACSIYHLPLTFYVSARTLYTIRSTSTSHGAHTILSETCLPFCFLVLACRCKQTWQHRKRRRSYIVIVDVTLGAPCLNKRWKLCHSGGQTMPQPGTLQTTA